MGSGDMGGSSGESFAGEFSGYSNPNGPGGPGTNRQAPRRQKPKPPPTLKDQAISVFQAGNAKRAYTLLQAYALQLQDEEATEVFKDYRWASHRKRPQFGVNIAVGVTVKNPLKMTDFAPIGSDSTNPAQGGLGEGGGMSFGGTSGMSGDGQGAIETTSKSLSERTGALSKLLIAAFKERHEKGVWAPAFKEYSLGQTRRNEFGSGQNGFGNDNFGGGSSGFTESGEGNPAGSFGGGMADGFSPNDSSSGMGSPIGSNGGMGTPPSLGSPMGSPSSVGGPTGPPPGTPMGPPPMDRLKFQGKPGLGFAGGMGSGTGDGFNEGGQPTFGGNQQGFGSSAKLPQGTTAIAPCMVFIGVDDPTKLMKKAVQDGYDALIIFEVTIGFNRAIQKVTNDTMVRVVQPNIVPKDVKKIVVSKSLNNIQVARSKDKGEPDGVDDLIEKTVRATEEALSLQPLPAALTNEIIATKRVPALIKETETSVIDRLSEVNLYYQRGLLDESQRASAYEQIAGQSGKVIANGSPAERRAEVEKLVDIELK